MRGKTGGTSKRGTSISRDEKKSNLSAWCSLKGSTTSILTSWQAAATIRSRATGRFVPPTAGHPNHTAAAAAIISQSNNLYAWIFSFRPAPGLSAVVGQLPVSRWIICLSPVTFMTGFPYVNRLVGSLEQISYTYLQTTIGLPNEGLKNYNNWWITELYPLANRLQREQNRETEIGKDESENRVKQELPTLLQRRSSRPRRRRGAS